MVETESIGASHLLLNYLTAQQACLDGPVPVETEEGALFSALRGAARLLLDEGFEVDVTFQMDGDLKFFSPEIDDEIACWESVDVVREHHSSRMIGYTQKGVKRFTTAELDDFINSSISSRAVQIIRDSFASQCLPR